MDVVSQPGFLFNSVLATALGLYVLLPASRRLDALAALLIYCTLHFSVGLWILFTSPNAREVLRAMHGEPVAGARVWGLAFVLFVLTLLAWRYRSEATAWLRLPDRRGLLLAVSGCAAALLLGLAWTALRSGVSAQSLKDGVAMLCMLALAALLAAAWAAEGPEGREEALGRLLRVATVLLVGVVLAALFELNTGQTRAYTDLPDGTRVERASSSFFDPNVLGMWCAAVAVFAGRFLPRPADGRWAAVALALAGVGLLSSGSRSGLILYLAMAAVLLLHRLRHGPRHASGALLPVTLTMGSLATTGGLAVLAGRIWPAEPRVVSNMALLFVERLLSLPLDVGAYLFVRFGLVEDATPPGGYDPTEMSVEGRFESGTPDNGYLAALDAAGLLGLAAWVGLLVLIALFAYRRVWPRADADAGYVLAAGFGCALSGVFLRTFMVFPLWVFVAVGMAAVLAAIPTRPKGEAGAGLEREEGLA